MSSDHSWNILYPTYINSNRTTTQGRRVPKDKAVADPKWQEIKDILEANGNFRVVGEPTAVYPREIDKEPAHVRGRVKYQLINPDAKFERKSQVLLYLAETIPKLKTRKAGGTGGGQSAGPSESAKPQRKPAKGNKGKK